MFATVKSAELIGLVALNGILAMVMSATFLPHPNHAGAGDRLSEKSVTGFVEQMTRASTMAGGGDIIAANKFLQDHLDGASTFKTSLTYNIPSLDGGEHHLALDKKSYINNVLADLKGDRHGAAATQIETIDIAPDSRHARVITTSYQRGPMPIQTADGQQTMQVKAVSYCEQAMSLKNRRIMVDNATCTTSVQPDR